MRKLTPDDVREIRRLWKEEKSLQSDIAEKFGIDQSYVSQIVNRKRWKTLGPWL